MRSRVDYCLEIDFLLQRLSYGEDSVVIRCHTGAILAVRTSKDDKSRFEIGLVLRMFQPYAPEQTMDVRVIPGLEMALTRMELISLLEISLLSKKPSFKDWPGIPMEIMSTTQSSPHQLVMLWTRSIGICSLNLQIAFRNAIVTNFLNLQNSLGTR